VEELESSVKDMARTLELNTVRASDGERKVKVCENDIAKNREKAEGYEARVAALEEAIQNHGKRLEELEESEGAAGEKEALNEEKVDFLTVQLKETEVRADAAERMNAVLTNTMVETETEIASWTKKIADMEELMVKMDDLADDPNYDVSKMVAAGKARPPSQPTSAKDMWGAKAAATPVAEADSRSSSRASSRAGRTTTRTPKDPTPEPEPEPESEEEEEEEEAPAPPPPKPAPAPEPEEESEEEESEEEESDEE